MQQKMWIDQQIKDKNSRANDNKERHEYSF